ncbi:MAG: pyridoxine 5'-phosphate synthase [Myxococcales bacterium]|nr:pyridoxine 5'-phosphate synthase [Myxococcales bacterium]
MARRLGVNVDHVATLRQARRARYPDPLAAALVAERAGASQITVHIRGDRRHIQDHDLRRLRESVQTLLNIEAACTAEMAEILLEARPHRVTLVAEREGEVTTEGGLEVAGNTSEIAAFSDRLGVAGIHVALFIDPDDAQVDASRVAGVDMVELNTARWAETGDPAELVRLARAASRAGALGLAVAAGHGLTLHNLGPLCAAAPTIEEYNIGHALIADAVFCGLDASVRHYLALLA